MRIQDRAWLLSHPFRVFSVLILTVFLAELAVMTSIDVFLPELSEAAHTLLDATLLTVLIAPVLWFVVVRPLRGAAVEERMRADAIVSHAADSIVTISEDGTVLSANPAVERLFGYTARETVGRNVSMLMPSPSREEHDSYIRRYLETGEKRIIGSNREVVGRQKDGSAVHIELAVSEMATHQGRVFIAAMRDIQARWRVEEELRRAKAAADEASRLKTLRFRFANLGACRNSGYTQQELTGLTPLDLRPEFTRDRR